MSLTAIAADVRTAAEASAAQLRTLLDEHLPQVEQLGELVQDSRIIASAEAAVHVPPQILDSIADLLDAIAARHPRPGNG